jgi:hypothetical protein
LNAEQPTNGLIDKHLGLPTPFVESVVEIEPPVFVVEGKLIVDLSSEGPCLRVGVKINLELFPEPVIHPEKVPIEMSRYRVFIFFMVQTPQEKMLLT